MAEAEAETQFVRAVYGMVLYCIVLLFFFNAGPVRSDWRVANCWTLRSSPLLYSTLRVPTRTFTSLHPAGPKSLLAARGWFPLIHRALGRSILYVLCK